MAAKTTKYLIAFQRLHANVHQQILFQNVARHPFGSSLYRFPWCWATWKTNHRSNEDFLSPTSHIKRIQPLEWCFNSMYIVSRYQLFQPLQPQFWATLSADTSQLHPRSGRVTFPTGTPVEVRTPVAQAIWEISQLTNTPRQSAKAHQSLVK